MTRDRRGRHETGLTPLTADHATVQAQARESILTHPGYKGRHRKVTR